jgi:hypothetical protein
MVVNMKNPPAFPSSNEVKVGNCISSGHMGMTLRDYMAAQAMQGLLTSDDIDASYATAVLCYRMADAMMKAREA